MAKKASDGQLGMFRPSFLDRLADEPEPIIDGLDEAEIEACFNAAFEDVFGDIIRSYEVRSDGSGVEREDTTDAET
jgi:hypothetical protein